MRASASTETLGKTRGDGGTEQREGNGLVQQVVFGALGGLYGAGAMSVMRLAMRRAGVIDKMTPQVIEEWISDRTGVDPPGGRAGRQVADQVLHLGYGLFWGAVAGPLLASLRGRASLLPGTLFGAALWAVGACGLFPLLGIARAPWRSSAGENATNIAAHLAYGVSVQLLTEELAQQPDRRRTSDVERRLSRVG